MKYAKPLAILLLAAAGVAFWSCGGGAGSADKNRTTVRSGELTFAVDESVEPLFREYVEIFEAQNEKADLKPVFTDETTALKMFLQDSTLLTVVPRPLTKTQIEQFKQKHKFAPEVKYFLLDAIVPLVHPDNPVDSLTTAQLRAVLRGDVTKWSELEPGAPDKPVEVVFDRNGSSVLRYMQDSLLRGGKLGGKAYAAGSHEQVFQQVAQKPYALGFAGFNWLSKETSAAAQARRDSVRMVALAKTLADLRAETDSVKRNSPDAEHLKFELPAAPHYVDLSDYSLADLTHPEFYKRWPLQRRVYFLKREPYTGLATGFASYFAGREGQMIAHKAQLVPGAGVSRLVQVEEKSVADVDKDGQVRSKSVNPAPEEPAE